MFRLSGVHGNVLECSMHPAQAHPLSFSCGLRWARLAEAVPNVRAAVVWSVAGCGYLGFIKKKEAQIST